MLSAWRLCKRISNLLAGFAVLGVDWVDLARGLILFLLYSFYCVIIPQPTSHCVVFGWERRLVGWGVIFGIGLFFVSFFLPVFFVPWVFLDSDEFDAFHCMHGCTLIWCGFSSQFHGWIDIISWKSRGDQETIKKPLLHSRNNKRSKVYETAHMNPSMGQSQCARLPLAIVWYHIKRKRITPEAN